MDRRLSQSVVTGDNRALLEEDDDADLVNNAPNQKPKQRRRSKAATIKSCNECRQQKLRCDVIREPYTACTRCRRLHIDCCIDSSFKRVVRRGANVALQREVAELKEQLTSSARQGLTEDQGLMPQQQSENDEAPFFSTLPLEVVDLPSLPSDITHTPRQLETIALSAGRIEDLFNHFFTFYHPFLPVLDPSFGPDDYFAMSPLLGWTIVTIASRRYVDEPRLLARLLTPLKNLLWATVREFPQPYHVVKALCLLCTWPLPHSSSVSDPTLVLGGIMMQIALQTGLHHPLHAQDFVKSVIEVHQRELEDRTRTWLACNVALQSVSFGAGQPSMAIYDWTLEGGLIGPGAANLPKELKDRLHIARFCDKVTKSLYTDSSKPTGLISEHGQSTVISLLCGEYEVLKSLLGSDLSYFNTLYLHAANLHFHAFAFFIPATSPIHSLELSRLYHSATIYIQSVLAYSQQQSSFLSYCPVPVQQSLVSALCVLLKILNSTFAVHLDVPLGRSLFNAGILTLRTISIRADDLPALTAEAIARLWRATGCWNVSDAMNNEERGQMSDPLVLNIRCRMSISHIFDCIWSWRDTLRTQQRKQPISISRVPAQAAVLNSIELPSSRISPKSSSMSQSDHYRSIDLQTTQESLITTPSRTSPFDLPLDDAFFNLSSMPDFDLFGSLGLNFEFNPRIEAYESEQNGI